MKVSRKGARFVGRFEGFRPCPYRDAVGVWTIGYGETAGVGPGTPCVSERRARKRLRGRLTHDFLPAVPRANRMRQQERDALASFAYNLGPGAVSDPRLSTLARRLKSPEGQSFQGRKAIYRQEMPKWTKAGGQTLPGLVKRRNAEIKLATRGDYSGRP